MQTRRSQCRSYRSYSSEYRVHRGGYFSAVNRFLFQLFTTLLLLLVVAGLLVSLPVMVLHLPQMEALFSQVVSWITAYGPCLLWLTIIMGGVFMLLGLIYALVRILTAISEMLSHAAVA